MPQTEEPGIAEAFVNGIPFSNGSDTGGPYATRRIRPKVDRIRAVDINQLRDMVEGLLYHTHDYIDNVDGGTTVINNSC
jgi:hypothetical protein